MGEAKRRGNFESRKSQAVQLAEYETARRRAEQAAREAAEQISGTSAKRRKQGLVLALMAALSTPEVLRK